MSSYTKNPQEKLQRGWAPVILLVILTLVLSGCGGTNQPEMITIGVVNLTSTMDDVFNGFKSGMEEAGYVDGQNVTYLYDGPVANGEPLVALLESLKNQNVDMVITFGTAATVQAKQTLEGTDIPVVFGPVVDPVKSGIVTDVLDHGGNITGVRLGNSTPKRLEWLLAIDPEIKQIFVVNNPDDASSVQGLALLKEIAPTFDVELEVRDARTPEEISTALTDLPEEVDAIFLMAATTLEARLEDFIQAANRNKLPLSAPSTSNTRDGALMSYGQDSFPIGKQAARLAIQILHGTKPADLPIEMSDLYMAINLKTANLIGLNITDHIIRQADVVVR